MSGQSRQTPTTKNSVTPASNSAKVHKSTQSNDMTVSSPTFDIESNGSNPAVQLLQLQRTIGNSAAIRLIQRSHGQGCGCSTCGGASAQQEIEVQRKAEATAHDAGCGCAACSTIQRSPDITPSSPTIQRLMTVDAFKKATKAPGLRNHIKPIDKAVAAYHKNSGGMASEAKIAALQNIIALCETYLNDPSRQKSKRRGGVEAIKNEAERDIVGLRGAEDQKSSGDESGMFIEEQQTPVDSTGEDQKTTTEEQQTPVDSTGEDQKTTAEEQQTPVDSTGEEQKTTTEEQQTPVDSTDEDQKTTTEEQQTPVDPEKAAATEYLSKLVKGEDIFAGTGPQAKTRKEILDILQKHLSDAEFTQAASMIILNVPDSVVEGEKARTVALGHLAVMFKDKVIARNLLDKNTVIVVIPKNKKMTELPQFASLAGKKTFDGRNWEDVRGSGGMALNGKIYVAVTEENTLGTDGTGDVSGTQWCYASGYSTTTHETAHVIDIHGLTAEDRKTVDDLYKAKKDKQKAGEVVEWIDGFDYDKPGTPKADAQAAFDEWNTVLPGKLTTAGMAEESDRTNTIAWAKYLMVDGGTYAANAYTAWLRQVGLISATADKIFKKDGTTVFASINATSKKVVYGGKQTCYASSHRLEYFAQSANAFFTTNVGNEPYVYSLWNAAGEPEKGKRRNGKSEVARIEPELKTLFDRIFGSKDIDDANPRDKVKQEEAAKANANGS